MRLLDDHGRIAWINPKQLIGEGHEAQVFEINDEVLAKVYKEPSSYDTEQDYLAAKIRLKEHQKKLFSFPTDLPPQAIGPISPLWNFRNLLLWKKKGDICGYLMRWVKDADTIDYYMTPRSRTEGVTDEMVIRALISLHGTLDALHQKGIVVGDLNHGNVLVRGNEAWVIDLDASQFGEFVCNTFEPDYLDPKLMDPDPRLMTPILRHDKFYSTDSDWYSFCCMVLACLTFVKPYQGSYQGERNIHEEHRPLGRLSIFHPTVAFPRFGGARHWDGFLPKELVAYLHSVFSQQDVRGVFPIKLLTDLLSEKVAAPVELPKQTPAWPTATSHRPFGNYVISSIGETIGAFDPVSEVQQGILRYLRIERGNYIRDNGHVVIRGETRDEYIATGQHRFHILHGEKTITVVNGQATLYTPGKQPEYFSVDLFGQTPSISSNGSSFAWYSGQKLYQAKDEVEKATLLHESNYAMNGVWMTPNERIVSYHRTNDVVTMTTYFSGSSQQLPISFASGRPRAIRVFEDGENFFVWSWHESDIRINVFTQDGTLRDTTQIPISLAPKPTLVCLQRGIFVTVTSEQKVASIQLFPTVHIRELFQVPVMSPKQLLPHPVTHGIVVLTTDSQIWQVTRKDTAT